MRSLVLVLGLMLTGCASYIDYGDGRWGVTRVSEERSPFGTNGGFMYLENCAAKEDPATKLTTYVDCKHVAGPVPIYSQGVGGQIVGGALTGLGFGLGSALSGASNSASAVSNSAASAASRGGHH